MLRMTTNCADIRSLLLILALSLSGCGAGGQAVSSGPIPVPAPAPDIEPPPSNALAKPQEFATFSIAATEERSAGGAEIVASRLGPSDLRFRYLGEGQGYQVEFPGMPAGSLKFTNPTNGSSRYTVSDASGQSLDTAVFLNSQSGETHYRYTDLAFWVSGASDPEQRKTTTGFFVYGTPSSAADIPRSGAGRYEAEVFGKSSFQSDIGGSAYLDFDFTTGKLAGHMDPVLLNKTGFGYDEKLERYVFADTIFGMGSARFSGRFAVPGSSGSSSFEGLFTGPDAEELMAQWQAPFRIPGTDTWNTMYGVWIGKKTE